MNTVESEASETRKKKKMKQVEAASQQQYES